MLTVVAMVIMMPVEVVVEVVVVVVVVQILIVWGSDDDIDVVEVVLGKVVQVS